MGAGTFLAIAIIVITVLFYTQVSELASGFIEGIGNSATANSLKPKPVAGQEVCDLRLTVRGDITHEIFTFPSVLKWNFGEESTFFGLINNDHGTTEYEWLHCSTQGSLSLASFTGAFPAIYFEKVSDQFENIEPTIKTQASLDELSVSQNIQELDLIVFTSESHTMEIRLVKGSLFFDKDNTSGMTKTVTLNAGLIPEPIAFEKTFLIDNIPKQNYNLEIRIVDQKINGQSANLPYTIDILG